MWSHEVSQLTGQFTQQALQQNMYANSVGMMNPGMHADVMAGNIANHAQAIGSPMLGAGSALLGLDPLSMGLKGAGLGMSMGMGMGGMAGMAAGFAAPAMIGGAAINWAGQQMWTGAQQQQQLNMGLRQNFGFSRPGGQGFNSGEMGMIGSQIRGMSHEQGAGGEMHGFRELSALAGNMGKMGFSQNITDVRQFTTKFKEMVTTLKTVAQELNTSLESAQQMVVGMRSSGIFSKTDQVKMSSMMRQNSLQGVDLETSSAMGNIGSQIARSVGGRGRSGAVAGVRAIGDVSTAVKLGVISEEDIYNSTGLTGMAGQQAMATQQLESSAKFLSSKRGRFTLASLADNNGNLNQDALNDFMSGNMDVGKTRGAAGRGIGRVGHASFLRNEGRLRSSVMEAVGGNAPAMQLMQWAKGSGIDIESMGDREMLFAGRQLGWGQDTLESAIKQAKAMPAIMRDQRDSARSDSLVQKDAIRMQNQGLNGVKNAYNKFTETLQSKVQSVGQNMYTEAARYLENYISEMSGTVTSDLTVQAEKDLRSYMRSGTSTAGGKRMAATSALGAMASSSQITSSKFDMYKKRVQEDNWMGGLKSLMGGQTQEEAMGLHFVPGVRKEGETFAHTPEVQFNRFSEKINQFNAGYAKASKEEDPYNLYGKVLSGRAGESLAGLKGTEYMGELNRLIGANANDDQVQVWNKAYKKSMIGSEDYARMTSDERDEVNAAANEVGVMAKRFTKGLPANQRYGSTDLERLVDGSGSTDTIGTKNARLGASAFSGTIRRKQDIMSSRYKVSKFSAATVNDYSDSDSAMGGLLGSTADDSFSIAQEAIETDGKGHGLSGADKEVQIAGGEYIRSHMEEGAAALIGGDNEDAVMGRMSSRIKELSGITGRNAVEEGEFGVLNNLSAARDIRRAGGWDKMSAGQRAQVAKDYGRPGDSPEVLRENIYGNGKTGDDATVGTAGAYNEVARDIRNEAGRKVITEAKDQVQAAYDPETGQLRLKEGWAASNPKEYSRIRKYADVIKSRANATSWDDIKDSQGKEAELDSGLDGMSDADLKSARSSQLSSGNPFAGEMVDKLDDRIRGNRRFKGTQRYGKAQAAKLADGSLSDASLRRIAGRSKSIEEELANIQEEGGLLGLDKEGQDTFKSATKKLRSATTDKDRREATGQLAGLKDNEGVTKAGEAKRLQQAMRDPSSKAMIEAATSLKQLLTYTVARDSSKVPQTVRIDGEVSVRDVDAPKKP